MSFAFLGLAWWSITLIVIGAVVGTFFLALGLIAGVLAIKGKRFNAKNKSCVKEENSVQPREIKDETIE